MRLLGTKHRSLARAVNTSPRSCLSSLLFCFSQLLPSVCLPSPVLPPALLDPSRAFLHLKCDRLLPDILHWCSSGSGVPPCFCGPLKSGYDVTTLLMRHAIQVRADWSPSSLCLVPRSSVHLYWTIHTLYSLVRYCSCISSYSLVSNLLWHLSSNLPASITWVLEL